jgi:hypothetical protein
MAVMAMVADNTVSEADGSSHGAADDSADRARVSSADSSAMRRALRFLRIGDDRRKQRCGY